MVEDIFQIRMNRRYYRLALDDFGRMKYSVLDPAWHRHAVYHLILISAGACIVEFDDRLIFRLERNDLLFINPLVKHRFRLLPNQTVEHTTMLWRFVDGKRQSGRFALQELYGVPAAAAEKFVIVKLSDMESMRLGEMHRQVLNLLKKQAPEATLPPFFFGSWLAFFAPVILRSRAPEEDGSPQLVDRMTAHLREAVGDKNFDNEALGEKLGHHHNYLNRVFREKTGYSLRQFLILLRLRKGCELLLRGNLTIQEIAERCGFAEAGYFSKVFRKYCLLSPGEFRRKEVDMPGFLRQRESLFGAPAELNNPANRVEME